jgi:hypothetical protein
MCKKFVQYDSNSTVILSHILLAELIRRLRIDKVANVSPAFTETKSCAKSEKGSEKRNLF